MPNRKDNKPTGAQQQTKNLMAPYTARYVAVDSHLTERNGSTDSVFGLAGERPAGRKFAQEIASTCTRLHAEGYEVISIVPLTSGRTVEATVEAEHMVAGRTFTKNVPAEPQAPYFIPSSESKHYIDTGVGYSVTDGVIITAKLHK